MGAARLGRPGEPLPEIFPAEAEQKAACRLLSDDAVTMDHIPESHFGQTVPRRAAGAFHPGYDDLGGGSCGTSGILALPFSHKCL